MHCLSRLAPISLLTLLVLQAAAQRPAAKPARRAVSANKAGQARPPAVQPAVVLPVQELTAEPMIFRQEWAFWRRWNKDPIKPERFLGYHGMYRGTDERRAELPQLLYRPRLTDSVWTAIRLVLPKSANPEIPGGPEWEASYIGSVEVDTLDLDGQGEPEVLVTITMSRYGSGGGTDWKAINLVDVSGPPRLLLAALVGVGEDWHGPAPTDDAGSRYASRAIHFEPRTRSLRIGPKKLSDDARSLGSLLTPLTTGRYRYRHGTMVRVGE